MNSLEKKHYDVIQSQHGNLVGLPIAAKSCTQITIEFAGKFAEWSFLNNYSIYWGNEGENCGKWYKQYTKPDRKYFTTDELITEYILTLTLTPHTPKK